tara:strand:- start:298 stop:597 length:300 start_codon:yes stop_codon:yes gene_type:complete
MIDWLKNLFSRLNQPARVSDDIKLDKEGDPLDALVFKLIDKGFHFNVENDWYERTWVVATKDGAETSKEVYKRKGDGWKVIMYGNEGEIFFKQEVNGIK